MIADILLYGFTAFSTIGVMAGCKWALKQSEDVRLAWDGEGASIDVSFFRTLLHHCRRLLDDNFVIVRSNTHACPI